jgi:hypothetical protein
MDESHNRSEESKGAPMNATSIASDSTRIIPARKERQAKTVTKQADGSLLVEWADGTTGTLGAGDELFQAFLIYTMLNPDTRR